ncbi:helix-turn-helix domain-containing protein [Microscilla marina]|uniref:Transcriptional regulator, AraC family protein n=1 Tax=Microscilla marina ATCC 23134 TaxID=313606 RepID=A1ZDC9_MICM2|nr:helix-turn-helix domain-containing protein [Microscilla marina]EAY31668.1 transcriptional regulator, AraC family protein [Microscilla marina ATCC 23134]
MQFDLRTPPYPLNQLVESVLFYDQYSPTHQVERLLPDGSLNLIVELHGVAQHIYDNRLLTPISTHKHAWLSGMHSGYISIDSGIGTSMLIIRFLPQGAYPFLHFPVTELNDLVIEADLVFGQHIARLREQLLANPSSETRFELVYRWLQARFKAEFLPPQAINYTLGQIHQNNDTHTFKNFHQQLGYSQKHLIALFKKYVGFRPKQYQQITRFNLALAHIAQGQGVQLTALGYDCGYYDQAHFIKEFKKFAGFSPKKFIREKGDYIHYLPLR